MREETLDLEPEKRKPFTAPQLASQSAAVTGQLYAAARSRVSCLGAVAHSSMPNSQFQLEFEHRYAVFEWSGFSLNDARPPENRF
jgi:hypothetical protein